MEQMIVIAALIVVGLFIGIQWLKSSKKIKHSSTGPGTGVPHYPQELPTEEEVVQEQAN